MAKEAGDTRVGRRAKELAHIAALSHWSFDERASSVASRPRGRPSSGNGIWVVSYVDPDGYRIDFESPTDVDEDTEYDPALHDR